jgi:hypothetical protein
MSAKPVYVNILNTTLLNNMAHKVTEIMSFLVINELWTTTVIMSNSPKLNIALYCLELEYE